ncbi:MAG: Mur ligase [Propionibacteriales bacterium]|nr:Mur ligase [Propionibacteriales bacterium]
MGALTELRLLDGPNLYFPRPAAKVTLDVSRLHALSRAEARTLAAALGMPGARPGPAHTAFRQRFAVRAVTYLVRRLAREAGYTRLAVRARSGSDVDELVVAYPWKHAGKATALGNGVAAVLDSLGTEALATEIEHRAQDIRDAPVGQRPSLLRPKIPVVAVTGTNGKTTTSRMLGHIARTAGRSVGWSSTDGVYLNGELVEPGDYSGPSGAGQVLRQPGVQLAVTETARGGILRRGVGVSYNDVSVVTNVTADHLGQDGIDTVDQLAEVKAVITRITKTSGWCVLNADDPRTFAMRLDTRAQVWVFTRDPDSPAARQVLTEGGRVTTVLDGWACVLSDGTDPLPVVEVARVPMTLAGLSRVNVENALGATSAALALGFTVEQVAQGLTSFDPGQDNPGRMNIWSRGGQSVVVDLAHNEAGLEALLEILAGIRAPGSRLLLGVGTAGDRTDEVFVRLGELAALATDHVEIAHKQEYLRGRTVAEIGTLLRAGAQGAGVEVIAEHGRELDAVRSLVAAAGPDDVIGVMVHQDRVEIDAFLTERGFTRDSPESLLRLVERARG